MTSYSTGNSHTVIVNDSETVEILHSHNNSNNVYLRGSEVLYVRVALHL